jgi:nitrile hydratase beta subunit
MHIGLSLRTSEMQIGFHTHICVLHILQQASTAISLCGCVARLMNGIHDMGGMDGFDTIKTNEGSIDTVGYHDEWEGLVHSAFVGTLGSGVHNMDEFRHAIERMGPGHYLTAKYYDRWLIAVQTLLVEKSVISPDELRERVEEFSHTEDITLPERNNPMLINELLAGVTEKYSSRREPIEPVFDVGDTVHVENMHPKGHTRCPEYVRRAQGIIREQQGTHTLPDSHAHGGDITEPMYNIEFSLDELWGENGSEVDSIRIELWESYLQEAKE